MAKSRQTSDFNLKSLFYVVLCAITFLIVLVIVKPYVFQSGVDNSSNVVSQKSEVKDLVNFVNSAKGLMEQKGEVAFTDFRTNRVWNHEDTYIFVYDMNGNTLVLPPQPQLEGVNRMGTADPDGRYFVKDMISILVTQDSGWIDYKYAKPGQTTPVTKLSYFKKVVLDGKEYLIGSGIYLE